MRSPHDHDGRPSNRISLLVHDATADFKQILFRFFLLANDSDIISRDLVGETGILQHDFQNLLQRHLLHAKRNRFQLLQLCLLVSEIYPRLFLNLQQHFNNGGIF